MFVTIMIILTGNNKIFSSSFNNNHFYVFICTNICESNQILPYRLSTRKDNFGNVTQFFYTNKEKPHEVSHIYSPRENRFMTLVYDDRGHLIYTQVIFNNINILNINFNVYCKRKKKY